MQRYGTELPLSPPTAKRYSRVCTLLMEGFSLLLPFNSPSLLLHQLTNSHFPAIPLLTIISQSHSALRPTTLLLQSPSPLLATHSPLPLILSLFCHLQFSSRLSATHTSLPMPYPLSRSQMLSRSRSCLSAGSGSTKKLWRTTTFDPDRFIL